MDEEAKREEKTPPPELIQELLYLTPVDHDLAMSYPEYTREWGGVHITLVGRNPPGLIEEALRGLRVLDDPQFADCRAPTLTCSDWRPADRCLVRSEALDQLCTALVGSNVGLRKIKGPGPEGDGVPFHFMGSEMTSECCRRRREIQWQLTICTVRDAGGRTECLRWENLVIRPQLIRI
jgi:hypothetical protein